MKIINFKVYKDGGTIEIETIDGIFCFDGRLSSNTKNMLYNGYPKKDNSNIIKNSEELKNNLFDELKNYKNDFYQSSIDHFINSKTI